MDIPRTLSDIFAKKPILPKAQSLEQPLGVMVVDCSVLIDSVQVQLVISIFELQM